MLQSHVIFAVFRRNVLSYFSGVLGYLFIVVFVLASVFCTYNSKFFANNLANLDQLNEWFPLLLLFIVPAITMSAWADEKKLGTDELLFTLPASDVEILLGKYLSVLAVYSVALLFSIFQLFVLARIADPDWSLLLTTYLGYWLSGAALLSAGMFASALTSNTTVAFVLGAVICAVPVFMGMIAPSSDFLQQLSLSEQFREFGMGLIPLNGLLYFVSLTVFMLYLNLVIISRRHWSGSQQANMGMQFFVRALSLLATLISLNTVAQKSGDVLNLRIDMTAEKLYTLSSTTRDIIKNIDKRRPVTIEAFLSPEMPRELVTHHKTLTGLLRQYDRLGGNQIKVRFVDVKPFSKQAEEAKLIGIQPRQIQSERGGRLSVEDVFLGAVVTSSYDEVVIPFFDVGTRVEYELTRSIRTVSNQDRLTVGILNTDARVNGGFDTTAFHSLPEWQIVAELKKQYHVEEVSLDPGKPIDEDKYDVLIAVLPSSLTQPQMSTFVDYVKKGKPTLIFDDPLPVSIGLQQAPRQPKPRPGGMFGRGGPPPQPKADGGKATTLIHVLDIAWNNGQVVWDSFNPHPKFAEVVRPEIIFISPASGTESAFNPHSRITSGLQELLTLFPGSIRPRAGGDLKFEALLRTGPISGLLDWDEITRPGFFFGGVTIVDNPPRFADREAHVLAAHVTSKGKKNDESKQEAGLNVIYVADVDCISDTLFNIAQSEMYDLKLDNVKFVLNAVDVLAGDESYLELRKQRAQHRILKVFQEQTDEFRKDTREAEEQAEKDADEQLKKARERFRKRREAIEKDSNLSQREKDIQLQFAMEDEERRLKVAEANIEREKRDKIEGLKAVEQRKIHTLGIQILAQAVILSPIPAIVLGFIVLSLRLYSERSEIEPRRLVEK